VTCCAYRLFNACQLADEFTYLGSAIAVRKCRRFVCVHVVSLVIAHFAPKLHPYETAELNFVGIKWGLKTTVLLWQLQ